MASLLLAAGEPGERSCLPNARIMVHQPIGGAQVRGRDGDGEAGRRVQIDQQTEAGSQEARKPDGQGGLLRVGGCWLAWNVVGATRAV